MDKYDLVLDLVEHPDRYSDAQICDILSDTECKALYTLICKTGATLRQKNVYVAPDIDSEWQKVCAHKKNVNLFKPLRPGLRAASMVALVLTSFAAVAIGLAVAVRHHIERAAPLHEPDIKEIAGNDAASVSMVNDSIVETLNSGTPAEPVLYKDEQLGKIVEDIAKHHNLTVEYRNKETAGLHLYFKFNPAASLEEVIDQLNTFERINIVINGNTLIID